MIHHTCDSCKRPLDPERELRYVLRMEIYTAIDDTEEGIDADCDHLQEIQDLLECIDDTDEPFGEDVYKQLRFDLCASCRQRILLNPIGRQIASSFNFSEN